MTATLHEHAVQEECRRGHACAFCDHMYTCGLDKKAHDKSLTAMRLETIQSCIMVLSNKGGVGKSTIAANIAVSLAQAGLAVGLADVDIHGPNAAKIVGANGLRVKVEKDGIQPCFVKTTNNSSPLKLASLSFFLENDDTPVVWRDAYKYDYIQYLFGSFNWQKLDYLVLDMPPGTGNELITTSDILEGHNLCAILVSTPESVALLDTIKAARFCEERKIPLLGVIENMTGITCPNCDHSIEIYPRHVPEQLLSKVPNLKLLAQLPFSTELAESCDRGEAIVTAMPKSDIAQSFNEVVRLIRRYSDTLVDKPALEHRSAVTEDHLAI